MSTIKNQVSTVSSMKAKLTVPRVLLASAVALLSAQAFAAGTTYPTAHFGLYMRGDLQSSHTDKASASPFQNTKQFRAQNIRLNFKGKLSAKTSYRIRYRLTDDLSGHSARVDNMVHGARYAYIDHKISSNLKVRMGKQYFSGACGREGDYSGLDVYQYSLACDNSAFYDIGVSLMPKVNGQSFVLAVVNPESTNKNQNKLGVSASWYGNLANGMIKPIVSYTVFPTLDPNNTTSNSTSNTTYWAAGARFTKNIAQVELDFMGVKKAFSGTVKDPFSGTVKDQKYNSVVLDTRLFLNGGKVQPILKLESSKAKNNGQDAAKEFKRKAFTLAVEYYPNHGMPGVDWRLHAAFTQKTDTPYDSTIATVKSNNVILGFSFSFTNG